MLKGEMKTEYSDMYNFPDSYLEKYDQHKTGMFIIIIIRCLYPSIPHNARKTAYIFDNRDKKRKCDFHKNRK